MMENTNEFERVYAEKMYYELRNEIQEKVKRIEKQSNINPTIIMLPFFFITPVYIRIAVTRRDIIKISDYMIEHYEKSISVSEGWEKYNRDNSQKLNKWFNFKYLDGIFSYLACLVIFVYACLYNSCFPKLGVIIAVATVFLIVIPITKYLVTAFKNR